MWTMWALRGGARGVLYAVADYSAAVQNLSPAQVEARVAALIRVSGVAILAIPAGAIGLRQRRRFVAFPGARPAWMIRWQDSDLRICRRTWWISCDRAIIARPPSAVARRRMTAARLRRIAWPCCCIVKRVKEWDASAEVTMFLPQLRPRLARRPADKDVGVVLALFVAHAFRVAVVAGQAAAGEDALACSALRPRTMSVVGGGVG